MAHVTWFGISSRRFPAPVAPVAELQCTEAMVANYGMSDKIGLMNFGQNDASSQFYKPYSSLAITSMFHCARSFLVI